MGEDFVQLVKDMRAAQKRFGDSSEAAAKARQLEKLVDQAIEQGSIPEGAGYRQTNLFS